MILPVLSSEFVVNMRDFSQSGLFLLCPDSGAVSVGAIVEVQTTEFDDAPVQKAKVARLEPGVGFAVEFLTE